MSRFWGGVEAAAGMAKTATVRGLQAFGDKVVDAAVAAVDLSISGLDAAEQSRPAQILTQGKLGREVTRIVGSAVTYAAFTHSETDSWEMATLKTAIAAGTVLVVGYNVTQSKKYNSVKEVARDVVLLTGATVATVVFPAVVAPTTSWMTGGYVTKRLLGSEESLATTTTATEFGAGVVTDVLVPGGSFVTRLVVNGAAAKALPPIVTGERPAPGNFVKGLVETARSVNTVINVVRNPLAHVKEFTDKQVAAFLAGFLPVMSKQLASHGVQITMNGFVPFMNKMTGKVLSAHTAFRKDPTAANLTALKTAMKQPLQGKVYDAWYASLQSKIEATADSVADAQLQQFEELALTWIGLPILADDRKAYLKGIASAFLTAYVPYLMTESPKLMGAMSQRTESELLTLAANVAGAAVEQTSLAVLSPVVRAVPVALELEQLIVETALPDRTMPAGVAIEPLSGSVFTAIKAAILALLNQLIALVYGLRTQSQPRVAKAASGPVLAIA